jgi:nucleoside-diphosphate-sugar epimerase
MKQILVSGGFGFIGSHLVERLLAEGHQVHVVDNLVSNPIPYSDLIAELPNTHLLTCDIADIEWYGSHTHLFPYQEFDEIYHLASPVGPAGILPHAGKITRQVIEGAYAVMNLAYRRGAKLVFVSTSEIYGGGIDGLCSESMSRVIQADVTVRLEYAAAKLAAEISLINTCRVRDQYAVIIRPFNVAGPRQSGKGGFVLPRFIQQAMAGEPLTVFGNGTQVRAFTHVRDIVDGLLLAMEKGRNCEAYNLGNPANKLRILDLANQVLDVIQPGGTTVFMDGKSIYGPLYAEANDKYPDASKAITELGWKPQIGVKATIEDVHQYMTRDERVME